MSRREEYEKRAEELLAPIVELNGFELVDVEYEPEEDDSFDDFDGDMNDDFDDDMDLE